MQDDISLGFERVSSKEKVLSDGIFQAISCLGLLKQKILTYVFVFIADIYKHVLLTLLCFSMAALL